MNLYPVEPINRVNESVILSAELDLTDLPRANSTSMLSATMPGPMCSAWRSTNNR